MDSSKLGAFTGEDERFDFRRTVSRLYEMPWKRWWESMINLPMKELPWNGELGRSGGLWNEGLDILLRPFA